MSDLILKTGTDGKLLRELKQLETHLSELQKKMMSLKKVEDTLRAQRRGIMQGAIESDIEGVKELQAQLKKLKAEYAAAKPSDRPAVTQKIRGVQTQIDARVKEAIAEQVRKQRELTAEVRKTERAYKSMQHSAVSAVRKAASGSQDAVNELVRWIRKVETLVVGYYTLKKALSATFGVGFKYNKELEDATVQLQSIAIAAAKNIDSFGNKLNFKQKTALAKKEITALVEELNKLKSSALATTPEMVDVAAKLYAQAKQAGATNKQIAELTRNILLLQKTQNISNAEMRAAIDNLVSGELKSGEFASALKAMGINLKELKETFESGGNSVEYLNKKLAELGKTGDLMKLTFTGIATILKNRLAEIIGKAQENVFAATKQHLAALTEYVNANEEQITAVFTRIGETATSLITWLFENISQLYNFLSDTLPWDTMAEAASTALDIVKQGFDDAKLIVTSLYERVTEVVSYMNENFPVIGETLQKIVSVIGEVIQKHGEWLVAAGFLFVGGRLFAGLVGIIGKVVSLAGKLTGLSGILGSVGTAFEVAFGGTAIASLSRVGGMIDKIAGKVNSLLSILRSLGGVAATAGAAVTAGVAAAVERNMSVADMRSGRYLGVKDPEQMLKIMEEFGKNGQGTLEQRNVILERMSKYYSSLIDKQSSLNETTKEGVKDARAFSKAVEEAAAVVTKPDIKGDSVSAAKLVFEKHKSDEKTVKKAAHRVAKTYVNSLKSKLRKGFDDALLWDKITNNGSAINAWKKQGSVWGKETRKAFEKELAKSSTFCANGKCGGSSIGARGLGGASSATGAARNAAAIAKQMRHESAQKVQLWANAVKEMGNLFGSEITKAAGDLIGMVGQLISSGKWNAGAAGGALDKLFGTDTYASSVGAAGQAIGSLFSPLGGVIGGIAGNIIGGFFGKKKKTDAGLVVERAIYALDDIDKFAGTYESFQKKSWFSKKRWDNIKHGGGIDIAMKSLFVELDRIGKTLSSVKSITAQFSGGKFKSLGELAGDAIIEMLTNVKVDFKDSNITELEKRWQEFAVAVGKTAADAAQVAKDAFYKAYDATIKAQRYLAGKSDKNTGVLKFDLNQTKQSIGDLKELSPELKGLDDLKSALKYEREYAAYIASRPELRDNLTKLILLMTKESQLTDRLNDKKESMLKQLQREMEKYAEFRKSLLANEREFDRARRDAVRDLMTSLSWLRTDDMRTTLEATAKSAKTFQERLNALKQQTDFAAQTSFGGDAYNYNLARVRGFAANNSGADTVQKVKDVETQKRLDKLAKETSAMKAQLTSMLYELKNGKDATGVQLVRTV